jgi:hypothetical protein
MRKPNKSSQPCQPLANAPTDYRLKLRRGITRLKTTLQQRYEDAFPDGRSWIQRAVADAETVAWATPFPALFFSALVHIRIAEIYSQWSRRGRRDLTS